MEVKFTPMYSCQLVLDLEKDRQRKIRETISTGREMGLVVPRGMYRDIEYYTMQDSVRLYCQMGVNRRWYDFQKEVTRNINAIDAGKMDEVTMPEMITDVDAWSDEDKLVYKALKESKIQKVGKQV